MQRKYVYIKTNYISDAFCQQQIWNEKMNGATVNKAWRENFLPVAPPEFLCLQT